MSIFDILVFLLIIVALHLYKAKYPNFLFFCKGSVLFLPPDDEPANNEKPKPKSKEKKDDKFEVTIVKI